MVILKAGKSSKFPKIGMIKIFIASNKPIDLYRCILQNEFIRDIPKVISVDDNERGLPERNNEFIEQVLKGEDCWLMFLHDDVAFLENPAEKIDSLQKDKIYGLCGVKKKNGKGEITGQIRQANKDNTQTILGIVIDGYTKVSTFDSLCTIVHSSLFRENPGLRFDENLMYHMHVEELSINAKENFNIDSAVVQIDCIHMSWGSKSADYHKAVEYVKQKHNLEAYICTCDKRALDHYQDDDGWKKM